ncbi:uncharacterized protein F5891DRAFT_979630 [Suillus fuscotomentosus]|uniref:Uncharacterized protein n=1 Tax=Suillus fuscotomentosus TaxID=1912939 RepID=A0AAD4E7K0_9AGAM|nr:uncharacterized protein F5891DRAFT_985600 [Suillus fuscotomentosus]XP_041226633.1 uncharacterized protein F5891DRAFT_979630 [Suillus fuscotomentosus]KAG1893691.1 hypothetical protein F5891DRAFT_985600 [Suillus fuscotomentosus]KAG1901057.1 hypothetical protein F5891DRAFT_979630 [Suillus fuscotomentosus]
MAPKKAKGGGKKGGSGGDEGGSHLLLNQRPIEAAPPKIDLGKETQKLDSRVAKCRAGVAWVNLLQIGDTLKFGVYNDRPENDAETSKLVAAFKTRIVPMKETSAIPIIVDLKRVGNKDSLLQTFDEPEKVCELTVKDTNPIVVASGQHRLSALRRYAQSVQDEYDSLEKRRMKIIGMPKPSADHVQQHNQYRAIQEELRWTLDNIGQWGVIVYDQEKLLADGDELAIHLSRNNTLHEYGETHEETLVRALKRAKVVYDTSPEDTRDGLATNMLADIRTSADKNSRLQKVLHHDRLCLFLATRLLALGPHVRHRPEFSVTWLSKAIDVCMGVYISWLEIRISTLRKLGSIDEFASYDTVVQLQERAEEGDEEAKKQLKTLRETMKKSSSSFDMSMWTQVLAAMDKHAKDAFGELTDIIGDMSPKYIMHLSSYRSKVIKTLRDRWNLTSHANFQDNPILTHLDRIVARVALHLTPQEGKKNAPEPLLGGFMMSYAWASFTKIEKGIAEVCRWFETLLDYYRMLHPKTHTMDDWSSVMMANIGKDPRFVDHGHNNPREHSLVKRPTEKKALDAEYLKLPEAEILASEALSKFLTSKRSKNGPKSRNLAMESQAIAGMMALHTTSWDWLSPSLKNGTRDIEPVMKAIAVERMYLTKYRPKLLNDKYVGALRRLIEQALAPRLEKVQILGGAGQLKTVQEWVWWDGLKLGESQMDPKDVLKTIEDTTIVEQQKTRDRLLLEERDREALNKLVTYVMGMPCVRSTSSATSLLSADVAHPFIDMIKRLHGIEGCIGTYVRGCHCGICVESGIELNGARLRDRLLNDDPTKLFVIDGHSVELGISVPEAYEDLFTQGNNRTSAEHGADENLEEEPAPKKKKKKGKSRAVHIDTPPVPEQDTEPDDAPARSASAPPHNVDDNDARGHSPMTGSQQSDLPATSKPSKTSSGKPKPRPVPRKQRQASPPPLDDDIEILDDSLNSGGHDVRTNDDDVVTPRPPVRPLTEDSVSSDGPSGTVETDQGPAQATVPSAAVSTGTPGISAQGTVASAGDTLVRPLSSAVATVASVAHDNDAGGIFTGTIPPLTPSPDGLPHGFGTGDTSWFDPNDEDEDQDMQDRRSSSEEDVEDEDTRSTSRASDVDDPHDKTYVPTQPLTQNCLPPRNKEPRVVATGPTKRARAETGASSSSSTHGRGRQTKKKPKVNVQSSDEEDDETIVPGV